jgi:serine/threonine protein phosphatase PrpC
VTGGESICPACAAPVAVSDTFCEACGADLHGELPPPATRPAASIDDTAPIPRTVVTAATCLQCGGRVLDDGFCGTCGQKAQSPRDHWFEQPAPWVAGVCDRGIAHLANEDAMALAATADRPFAVLVVCDGVTSAPNSDRAALAASRAACSHLSSMSEPRSGGVAAAVTFWSDALNGAASEANSAAVGVAHTLGDPAEPPSCTFVAAVVSGSLITVAWCGDSRAYWLPDAGEARQLTVDHSLGTELMAAGKSRSEAEADPSFHTITRWLGADSVDHSPELVSQTIDGPGWFLVCSDGLWNYASAVDEIAGRVRVLCTAGATDPLPLAAALVDWANASGGHDNVTAALARCEPSLRLEQGRTTGG